MTKAELIKQLQDDDLPIDTPIYVNVGYSMELEPAEQLDGGEISSSEFPRDPVTGAVVWRNVLYIR